jgi:2-oxoglutarate dehydrogenase E1 component
MVEQYRQGLDEGRPQARASLGLIGNKYTVDWSPYSQVDWTERVQTGLADASPARARGAHSRGAGRIQLQPRVAQVMANRKR